MTGVLVICQVCFGRALSQCSCSVFLVCRRFAGVFLSKLKLSNSIYRSAKHLGILEVWMIFLGGAFWLLYMVT